MGKYPSLSRTSWSNTYLIYLIEQSTHIEQQGNCSESMKFWYVWCAAEYRVSQGLHRCYVIVLHALIHIISTVKVTQAWKFETNSKCEWLICEGKRRHVFAISCYKLQHSDLNDRLSWSFLTKHILTWALRVHVFNYCSRSEKRCLVHVRNYWCEDWKLVRWS